MFISCSCDEKAKKLYFYTFIFMISYGCFILLGAVYYRISVNLIFYVNSSSRILVIIPHFITKLIFKNDDYKKQRAKLKPKNTINDYIILILNIIVNWLFALYIFVCNDIHLSTQGLLILILSLHLKIIHKRKFEKHKIFCLVLLIIFFLLYDIISCILTNKIINLKIIISQFILILLYSSTLIYRKYLIEEKYISPYAVCSLFGTIDFSFLFLLGLISYKFGNFLYINNTPVDIPKFDKIIEDPSIILKFIPFIIFLIIYYISYYLLIDELTLIHPVILETITTFAEKSINILNRDIKNKGFYFTFFLISFIIVVIILFVYIEIIELKCCGLNYNTRRNLLKREQFESSDIQNSITKTEKDKFRLTIDSEYDIEFIDDDIN